MQPMEPDDPPPKKYAMKPRVFEQLNAKGSTGKAPEHDVFAILQQNRAVEQNDGKDLVEIREVKSRRKRDYWLLLLPMIGTFALVAWFGRGNQYVLVFSCSAIGLVTVGLTWIMWVVMDNY